MRFFLRIASCLCVAVIATACMGLVPYPEEDFSSGNGVFVVCEGNFGGGNASLSFYDSASRTVENEVYDRANSMPLGDVAQSMTIHNGRGYIVVNNSGAVFIIDPDTFRVVGHIDNLVSPRHIHFLSDTKAYVTNLFYDSDDPDEPAIEPFITIINPQTLKVTGRVPTLGHKSTEQMVQWGQYVFVNCWSFDNVVLVIDTATDEVVDAIEVGNQPKCMVMDSNDNIWVLTDGGYSVREAARLSRIDPATRTVTKEFRFAVKDTPAGLCLNAAGNELYFINKSVWQMGIDDERLPIRPFVTYDDTIYYSIGVDPTNGDVYIADAIDHMQSGVVYRYSQSGELIDSFRVGKIPGAFCFK